MSEFVHPERNIARPSGAALFTMSNIAAAEEPLFHEWYNREHMRDRVLGIDGFRRGRRFAAIDAPRKYVAFYEVADGRTFTSADYVALVREPDPASRHYITRFTEVVRTIGTMVSAGEGEGPVLGVLPLPRAEGDSAASGEILSRLVGEKNIIAAHLLSRSDDLLKASAGQHVRQGDTTLDRCLLVEAMVPSAIEDCLQATGAAGALGGSEADRPATYRLLYRVSPG